MLMVMLMVIVMVIVMLMAMVLGFKVMLVDDLCPGILHFQDVCQ